MAAEKGISVTTWTEWSPESQCRPSPTCVTAHASHAGDAEPPVVSAKSTLHFVQMATSAAHSRQFLAVHSTGLSPPSDLYPGAATRQLVPSALQESQFGSQQAADPALGPFSKEAAWPSHFLHTVDEVEDWPRGQATHAWLDGSGCCPAGHSLLQLPPACGLNLFAPHCSHLPSTTAYPGPQPVQVLLDAEHL